MGASTTRTTTSLIGSISAVELTYQQIGAGAVFPVSPIFSSIGVAQKAFLLVRLNSPALSVLPIKLLILFSTDAAGLCRTQAYKEVVLTDVVSNTAYLKVLDITPDVQGFSYISVQVVNPYEVILPCYLSLIVDEGFFLFASTEITGLPSSADTVTDETSFGVAKSVGTGTDYAREDHTHGSPAAPSIPAASSTVVSETSFGITPAVGSAATFSKGDHTHGSPTAPNITTLADVTSSRAYGTVYQNTGTKPLFVTVRGYSSSATYLVGKTGVGNPPTTIITSGISTGSSVEVTIFFIVLPNNYYLVDWTAGTKTLLIWLEYV